MEKKYDAIVVGAGPAGLFCACMLAQRGIYTLVLEKNSVAGKKLLLSGQGRCNITHIGDVSDLIGNYPDRERFVRHAVYSYSNSDLMEFFDKQGISFIEDDKGCVFPSKGGSCRIKDILLDFLSGSGAEIVYGSSVIEIKSSANGCFSLTTLKRKYRADSAVIAVGGQSYPESGSTGDGYKLASGLGHNIIPIRPGLAGLVIRDNPFAGCAGVSFPDVQLRLVKNGKFTYVLDGALGITHKGISGPVVLNASRCLRSGDQLSVSFVREHNNELFKESFFNFCAGNRSVSIKRLLTGYVPQSIAHTMCQQMSCVSDTVISQLNKTQLGVLCRMLCDYRMEILFVGSMKEAMVTAGGVDTSEINSKTMESKLVQGLYFAGEVIDVDGFCGGYNLQFAFSSAFTAAEDIAKKKGKQE